MIGIVLLVVIVVVVLLALGQQRSAAGRAPRPPRASSPPGMPDALDRAVAAGTITAGQAAEILTLTRSAPAEPEPSTGERMGLARTIPPVLEAVGYLGAILVIGSSVILVSRFWDDLASWSRVAILGTAAAVLTVGGLLVRDETDPVLWRLRSVMLLLASAATGGTAGLLVVDVLDLTDEPAALMIGAVVAIDGALLWWRRDRPAQHLTFVVGSAIATVAALVWAGAEPGLVGLAMWAGAAGWLAGSLRRLFPPALLGMTLGAAGALISAGVVSGEWEKPGVLFGLATAAGLLAIGVRLEEFMVTASGVIGTFFYLPAAVATFFGETIGVPAVMLLSGLALLALTVVMVQHRSHPGAGPRPHAT